MEILINWDFPPIFIFIISLWIKSPTSHPTCRAGRIQLWAVRILNSWELRLREGQGLTWGHLECWQSQDKALHSQAIPPPLPFSPHGILLPSKGEDTGKRDLDAQALLQPARAQPSHFTDAITETPWGCRSYSTHSLQGLRTQTRWF